MEKAYWLALSGNLCFALGSQVYTLYSRSISSLWMNFFKNMIGLLAFGLTLLVVSDWHPISFGVAGIFFLSGALGLGIGDLFLLRAFSEMGPGRTLILFSFQPLILGTFGFLIFGQTVDSSQFFAVFFFMICLGIISLESFRAEGSWHFKGILMALGGMSIDAVGIVLTRYAFEQAPELTALEGNFYRCIGGVFVLIFIAKHNGLEFIKTLVVQTNKSRAMLIIGSLLGTYLSLWFYLKAIQTANLASLGGVAITGTIFSSLFECIFFKKRPSIYFLFAFVFFLVGMYFMMT